MKPSRPQTIALVVFLLWAALVALGLAGGSLTFIPRQLTQGAGLVALVGGFSLIPIWLLRGLIQEPGVRKGSVSWLAIGWRWWMAFWGPVLVVVGAILLFPTTQAALEIRIGGAFALYWGVFYVWIAVLAFRKNASVGSTQSPGAPPR